MFRLLSLLILGINIICDGSGKIVGGEGNIPKDAEARIKYDEGETCKTYGKCILIVGTPMVCCGALAGWYGAAATMAGTFGVVGCGSCVVGNCKTRCNKNKAQECARAKVVGKNRKTGDGTYEWYENETYFWSKCNGEWIRTKSKHKTSAWKNFDEHTQWEFDTPTDQDIIIEYNSPVRPLVSNNDYQSIPSTVEMK